MYSVDLQGIFLDLMQPLDIFIGVQDQNIYLWMNHLVQLISYPKVYLYC
jgi:hypothetical protein